MKALTQNEMVMVQGGAELECITYLISAGIVTAVGGLALGPIGAVAAGSFLLGASPC